MRSCWLTCKFAKSRVFRNKQTTMQSAMGILCQVSTLILLLLVPLSCTFGQHQPFDQGRPYGDDAVKQIHLQRENLCQEVPPKNLRQVLGSAYNEYYMSFEQPQGSSFTPNSGQGHKRRSELDDNGAIVNRPFFVKQDLEVVLSEEPAWKVDFAEDYMFNNLVQSKENFSATPVRHRVHVKRSAPEKVLDAIGQSGERRFKWHCEAPLRWMDLGPDYFPRYILSVDCNYYGCKGPRFKCEPRSFAIKVLRRREGVCAPGFKVHRDTLQIGSDQMSSSLRQLWVWEMRAITFCCVCEYE